MPSSNVCSLLIASSHDLTCIQGFKLSRFSPKQSAQPHLYGLSQHSTQVQLHFFVTVLQQMAGLSP